MQGVDISGQDRAQQFECLYPGDQWGPVGTCQALTDTDQPDINTPGDTLLPSPPLSSIISPHLTTLFLGFGSVRLIPDKVTEQQRACGEIIVRCGC